MDIDIDTLIYLILTIVFVIVGALGKKKTPGGNISIEDAEQSAAEEMEREGAIFEENYRRIFEDEPAREEYQEEYADEVQDEPINTEMANLLEAQRETQLMEHALDSSEDRIDNLQDEIASEEEKDMTPGISDFDGIRDEIKDTEMGSEREQEVFVSGVEDILTDFSGKNAVIYSEILNPKYF